MLLLPNKGQCRPTDPLPLGLHIRHTHPHIPQPGCPRLQPAAHPLIHLDPPLMGTLVPRLLILQDLEAILPLTEPLRITTMGDHTPITAIISTPDTPTPSMVRRPPEATIRNSIIQDTLQQVNRATDNTEDHRRIPEGLLVLPDPHLMGTLAALPHIPQDLGAILPHMALLHITTTAVRIRHPQTRVIPDILGGHRPMELLPDLPRRKDLHQQDHQGLVDLRRPCRQQLNDVLIR
jgi:hypothetical protein